jgi:hypothetical protein
MQILIQITDPDPWKSLNLDPDTHTDPDPVQIQIHNPDTKLGVAHNTVYQYL